uniref:Uncharacterized protein n=1 Tax=Cajanus cajan TaxID=3821 RepID=A0A151SKS6_CAJCA|nr:hypothetical protein KK1_001666 [Cajanus cajan]
MNLTYSFQALVNEILMTILRRFVLVFFDYILVYNFDWETHRNFRSVKGIIKTTLVTN